MIGLKELQAFAQVLGVAQQAFSVNDAWQIVVDIDPADGRQATIKDIEAIGNEDGTRTVRLAIAGKLPEPNVPPPLAVGCRVGQEVCSTLGVDPNGLIALQLNFTAAGVVTATTTRMVTVEQVKGLCTGPFATLASEWAQTLPGKAEERTESVQITPRV